MGSPRNTRRAPITGRFTAHEVALAARNRGMPLEALRHELTPPGLHYLLIHFDIPPGDERPLEFRGLFQKNISMELAQLKRLPSKTLRVTLECAGNGRGQLAPLGERELAVYRELKEFGSRGDARFNGVFQDNLALGRPNEWSCRAGARYLYVCEEGLVHWCSQQRGYPGIPLEQYTMEDFDREYKTEKWCAPTCTPLGRT